MKNVFFTFLFVFIFIAGYSQQKVTRKLASFNDLSVGEAISVTLIHGNSEQAEIEITGTDPENVLTEITGDHLNIHMAHGNWRNVHVDISLTYRELHEIEISSAAKVQSDEPIRSESLEIDVSSAAKGDLAVETGSLEIDISSAGKLMLKGSADKLEADLSSAGHLDAYELRCGNAELEVSSAGSANINVSSKIDAKASSGGHIKYRGNPQKVFVSSSSGGSVTKED